MAFAILAMLLALARIFQHVLCFLAVGGPEGTREEQGKSGR